MNTQISPLLSVEPIQAVIKQTLACYTIPRDIKRIAINFKCSQFYINKQGIQPIEIQLERTNAEDSWEIRFIATFDYPTQESKNLDVSLYFNFHFGWFYQPDIERCELDRPEVKALFETWLNAFLKHLQQGHFDIRVVTAVKTF
ncbi:DUF2787 family protein [Vibrio harveyi]